MSQPEQFDRNKSAMMDLLKFIDSPFKLFVVLLLGVVGFVGYFVYDNKSLLLNIYDKSSSAPTLNTSKFDDAIAVLMKDQNVIMVSIFSVDTIFNKRILLRGQGRDGVRNKIIEGSNVGLFSSDAKNNTDVVALMASEVPCSLYTVPQSEAGVWYIEIGVRYTCRVSVPPELNSFVGQITIGYRDVPENIDYAKAMATVAARMITRDK